MKKIEQCKDYADGNNAIGEYEDSPYTSEWSGSDFGGNLVD